MTIDPRELETLRECLCAMQRHVLAEVLAERERAGTGGFSGILEETAADTVYAPDRIAERAILDWFADNWPARWPVEVIMEGREGAGAARFPEPTPPGQTVLKCLIDPVDGTRGFMFDKRPAWILAGIAPDKGADTRLSDVCAAAMTELPLARQWRADQISAVRDAGLKACAFNVREGFHRRAITLQPSAATDVRHAFGTIVRFFPAGLTLLAELEETLWSELYGQPETPSPLVFNDQYISTGGQLYEIMSGRDRFIADLRPLAFRKLGTENHLACHPYDVVTELLAREAGCVVEQPDGRPLDAPLDTVTPVSWVAYANRGLADHLRPALRTAMARIFGEP